MYLPPLALFGLAGFGRGALRSNLPQSLLHARSIRREGVGHGRTVRRAVRGLWGQTVLHDCDQLGVRAARIQTGVRLGEVASRDPQQDFARRVPRERNLAGQDFAKHDAQGKHVGSCAHAIDLAAGLFRRHVRRRAHDLPALRSLRFLPASGPVHLRPRFHADGIERRVGFNSADFRTTAICFPSTALCYLTAGFQAGQPPVHDLDFTEGADHHVGRFQIAVDDALRMREGNRLANRFEDLHEWRGFAAGAEEMSQSVATDEFHRQERPAVGKRAERVDRRNAGVRKPGRDLRFSYEAKLGVVHFLAGKDHLDCDFAIERQIVGGENAAHGTAGNLSLHLIAGNLRQGLVRANGGRWLNKCRFCTRGANDSPFRIVGRGHMDGTHRHGNWSDGNTTERLGQRGG